MPLHTHICLTVTCDVCGEPLVDDGDGVALHFPSRQVARTVAAAMQWAALSDNRFVCNTGDGEHQTAIDELMPPEPTVQATGQLNLDGGAA